MRREVVPRAVLVDAGRPAQHRQLQALLDELGLAPAAIEAVVVTHGTSTRALAASTPGLDPYLRQGVRRATPVVDARDLDDGDVIDGPGRLRFLSAPGHTPGGGRPSPRTGATVLLPGHGEPWRGDAALPPAEARRASR